MCVASLRVRWQNTKEARYCIISSLELFKEHTAPQLHFNAIIILVLLFADTTLTFNAFFGSFFSRERKLAAEHSSRVPRRLFSSALAAKSKTNVSGKPERVSPFLAARWGAGCVIHANKSNCGERLLCCDSCHPLEYSAEMYSSVSVTVMLHLHIGFS